MSASVERETCETCGGTENPMVWCQDTLFCAPCWKDFGTKRWKGIGSKLRAPEPTQTLDTSVQNLHSLLVGAWHELSHRGGDPELIERIRKVVLPRAGEFGAGNPAESASPQPVLATEEICAMPDKHHEDCACLADGIVHPRGVECGRGACAAVACDVHGAGAHDPHAEYRRTHHLDIWLREELREREDVRVHEINPGLVIVRFEGDMPRLPIGSHRKRGAQS